LTNPTDPVLIHFSYLQRLALRRQDKSDENMLVQPLLNIMADHKLDFHATFRKLSFFNPSLLTVSDQPQSVPSPNQNALENFISDLLSLSPEAQSIDHAKATQDWMAWLEKYAERVLSERDQWAAGEDWDAEREAAAKAANPRFVLRQWVLEEVIRKVEEDAESGKKVLAKVLQVRMISVPLPSFVLDDFSG
jgi:serine/tyrosine/threonine adenylyltransferase